MDQAKRKTEENIIEVVIDTSAIKHEKGYCFIIDLPKTVPVGSDTENPKQSCIIGFKENDTNLGPSFAMHSRIRSHGAGLHSHWQRSLYFSSSDNSSPLTNGRRYSVIVDLDAAAESPKPQGTPNDVTLDGNLLFPRLAVVKNNLEKVAPSRDHLYDPAQEEDMAQRMRLLEAKVEYLLDELYTAKSQLRQLTPECETIVNLSNFQLTTFDYQWGNLPYHDEFLTNPDWYNQAIDDILQRSGLPADWFKGKKILDCGCGPGRHTWAFAKLGATVTSFDMSDRGITAAREFCKDFPNVTIEKGNILEELPYACDYDLVWCFGVIHCTGNTMKALNNISRHVKPGGTIYFMVYAEPSREDFAGYAYYHEVYAMRQAIRHLNLGERAALIRGVQGERHALGWFDAVSSEINDLYTMEELTRLLSFNNFVDIRRTMPQDVSHNVVATKAS